MSVKKSNYPFNKLILVLLFFSVVGLFLPWLYFDRSVDYTTGLDFLVAPLFFSGLVGSIVLSLLRERSQMVNIVNLVALLLIPSSCIFQFLTWHVMTITGKIDLSVSFSTAHCGFYLTFFSSLTAALLFAIGLVKRHRRT
ncbi:Uncharacterised protein [uncultured Eubacterium sp.]|nr:Uncharacterised protein [uncultured Eubacterium sp.]